MSKDDTTDHAQAARGAELIQQFFALLRIARMYGANNEAWTPALAKVHKVVTEEGGAVLRIHDKLSYLGDVRIRMEREGYAAQEGLLEAFASHNVGGIEIDTGYDDEELKILLTAWGSSSPQTPEEGFDFLDEFIITSDTIRLTRPMESKPSDENQREMSKAIYARTLSVVEDVMDSVKISQTLPLKRAKRVMHRMIDELLADPTNLMGLTNLRCYDEYTFHHSVNVCVLSLSLGRRLGLPRPMLEQLGMASLFHDIGKSRVPIEVLNKPGEFNEEEWDIIRAHPVHGVKTLVKIKGADELASRVMTGSFEHHMNYDNSGYPKLPKPRSLSLYGRMIGLCDCYDAMTSARVYNRTPFTPEKALKFMLSKAGKAFDPVLIKVFVNTVGIFPVGTLLLLDSGEMAVVSKANEDPVLGDRPEVRVISDKNGKPLADPVDLALDEKTAGGSYQRNIKRILDAADLGIDVSYYFL